jgi:hypothetical protein
MLAPSSCKARLRPVDVRGHLVCCEDGRKAVTWAKLEDLFKMFKKIAAALLILCAIGCQNEFIDPGETRVRTVLLSPNAPNLDVSFSNELLLSNAPYTTSTGYIRVLGGTRTLEVRETGTTPVLVTNTAGFTSGARYTYVVVGLVGTMEGVIITDGGGDPPVNQTSMRVFHGSPSLGNVDIYITAPGAPLGAATPVATNVAYKSMTTYTTRLAGTYQVRATTPGTTTEIYTSPNISPTADQKQTTFITEAPGGGAPLSALVLLD